MKSKLLVFLTKYPEIGKVKTRLGKEIGNKKSAEIQKKFINHFLKSNYYLKNKSFDIKICLQPIEKSDKFSLDYGVDKSDLFSVNSGELGNVMSDIFEYGFKEYREVILIGSDILNLRENDFNKGFNLLKTNDIVLGPTYDGGYYLLGMKKNNKFLFEDIIYSTETVYEETISKIKYNDLSFGLLVKRQDIDTYNDLINVAKDDKSGFLNKIIKEI